MPLKKPKPKKLVEPQLEGDSSNEDDTTELKKEIDSLRSQVLVHQETEQMTNKSIYRHQVLVMLQGIRTALEESNLLTEERNKILKESSSDEEEEDEEDEEGDEA